MRKIRFFANFDKEEAWLNKMADQGHLLTRARLFYRFSASTPGSAVIRVDYRSAMGVEDFDDYLGLFRDSGWEHLDGTRSGGPQYFASFSDDAEHEIFSDAESKAQRYRRSIATWGVLLLPFLVVVISLRNRGVLSWSSLASPKDWYLTPGLWQMEGTQFVTAFLFESIFVALRVGGPLILVGFCLYLLVFIGYQCYLYRQTRVDSKLHTT